VLSFASNQTCSLDVLEEFVLRPISTCVINREWNGKSRFYKPIYT
jgi:hypothetical protein